ncbi:MAG: trypsin-like peptidase domain-containing protein [Planctomycetaceae bacterium]|nr:trypsin-like peptidase domain-containing protein [Planctomycetaceae bacterium]
MSARIRTAGERESGALCVDCRGEIPFGTQVAVCTRCGGVHHEGCWESSGGCGAYECPDFHGHTSSLGSSPGDVIHVTMDELDQAVPLPSRPTTPASLGGDDQDLPRSWNRTAVWAFIISLLGIPLFGLITGIAGMITGCIALVGHSRRDKGFGLAVAAVIIGLLDVVGWSVGLITFLGPHGAVSVSLDEFVPDEESLNDLPEHLARSMRANVLISASHGPFSEGIGSGVILKVNPNSLLIVTNRHVIDHNFQGKESDSTEPPSSTTVDVQTVGDSTARATIEWVAPHGIDLALLTVPIASQEIREAFWNVELHPQIGDAVFAIGNPHGLGWTHSAGDISQVRRQIRGPVAYQVLQTTAAINPGNSGGGLYSAQGRLLGINTLTGDKRVAEGLGFSIAIETLIELAPERFDLRSSNQGVVQP